MTPSPSVKPSPSVTQRLEAQANALDIPTRGFRPLKSTDTPVVGTPAVAVVVVTAIYVAATPVVTLTAL